MPHVGRGFTSIRIFLYPITLSRVNIRFTIDNCKETIPNFLAYAGCEQSHDPGLIAIMVSVEDPL